MDGPLFLFIYIKYSNHIRGCLTPLRLCSAATSAHLDANNESSEVFDIIKPGRRVKIKGYRQ